MNDDPNRVRQKSREFKQELLRDIAQEQARYERGIRDGEKLARVQKQIASLKKHGGDDATEPLARLAKDHYDLAGADGGALGTRTSTAERMRAAREAAGIEPPNTDGPEIRQERRQRL